MDFLDYLAVFFLTSIVTNVIGETLSWLGFDADVPEGWWAALALGLTVILWAVRRLSF